MTIDTVGDPVLMRAALGILSVRGRLSYTTARPDSTDMTFDMNTMYIPLFNFLNIIGDFYDVDPEMKSAM